jgi:hypothetical protein
VAFDSGDDGFLWRNPHDPEPTAAGGTSEIAVPGSQKILAC